eukprot:EG_transcript_9329
MGNRPPDAPAEAAPGPDEATGLLGRHEAPGDALRRLSLAPDSPSLLQRVASMSASGVHPTFLCGICLCYEDLHNSRPLDSCGHEFCRPCLTRYVASQITDGQPYIQCPAFQEGDGSRCRTVLTPGDVSDLITDGPTLAKFRRFKAARDDPNSRACPRCGHLQTGDPQLAVMLCGGCGRGYCFAHGDAHDLRETCQQFEERCKALDDASAQFVMRTSKQCPGCQVQTYKFTGCNHMKCTQCNVDWCWLCGEELAVTGPYLNHYDRRNALSPCAGRQFTPDEVQERGCCSHVCRFLLFYSPLALPFYLFAIVLYIALTLVLLPRLCTDAERRRAWLRPLAVVTGIVTCCWALTAITLCSALAVVLFLVSWAVGLVVGLLCLPFALIFQDRNPVPQAAAFCCCCWVPILLAAMVRGRNQQEPAEPLEV